MCASWAINGDCWAHAPKGARNGSTVLFTQLLRAPRLSAYCRAIAPRTQRRDDSLLMVAKRRGQGMSARLDTRLLPALLLAGVGLACSLNGPYEGGASQPVARPAVQEYVDHYLADAKTPDSFKDAIRRGVVVEGMCPLQAFAAAGLPGPYMVRKDRARWTSDVPPPVVIEAQCAKPDESVIELLFQNKTQFSSKELRTFRVRFQKGKAMTVDQKGFKE